MRNVTGKFVDPEDLTYQIEGTENIEPFFMTMAGDGDLWAFISSNGSLAAGRRDSEGSFFPYETVDKIHSRWESVGPRTWIRIKMKDGGFRLWEPFAARLQAEPPFRSVSKDSLGSKVTFHETDPVTKSVFSYSWSFSKLGLVRDVHFHQGENCVEVEIVDGLLGLLPPGVTNQLQNQFSVLADAYKWNEIHAGGRLGVYTLYAQIWDRAEPKESLQALTVWSAGDPAEHVSLSSDVLRKFVEGQGFQGDLLSRGKVGCFLEYRNLNKKKDSEWIQVVDGPHSQSQVAKLKAKILSGEYNSKQVQQSVKENRLGLMNLLSNADYLQKGKDLMAVAHHQANVLFNIQRGGVFSSGTLIDVADFLDFIKTWNKQIFHAHEGSLKKLGTELPRKQVESFVLSAQDPQLERLFREYLPLSFSRRHGDPSRPWNKFSIKVVDENGKRVLNYQGNWRDIFQNWEALAWSWPEYLDSFITKFLSAITVDGYNPYRIGRNGLDWEVPEPENPWSNIGYWGDHQLIYLLKFLEMSKSIRPGLLESFWDKPIFATANVPYRLANFETTYGNPRDTVSFDAELNSKIEHRVAQIGSDGRLVPGRDGNPALQSFAEKILTLLLVKVGNLIPGVGIWLNTQRPEWNDANNALVGFGTSVVSLSYLHRFVKFILSFVDSLSDFSLRVETRQYMEKQIQLLLDWQPEVSLDAQKRYAFVQRMGLLAESWRQALYSDGVGERQSCSKDTLKTYLSKVLEVAADTLKNQRRKDGLWNSYNLVVLGKQSIDVSYLYPMLEGQVAILSSGYLDSSTGLDLLKALKSSDLYDPQRNTYLLYPDRHLPGFLEKNIIDETTSQLKIIQKAQKENLTELVQADPDGTLRFGANLSNRSDLEVLLKRLSADPEWKALVSSEGQKLAERYEIVFHHREFTGRSATMFAYEGLGCVYWHMVSKLLLAVQENLWNALDKSLEVKPWIKAYEEIRQGLGYHKTPQGYGAFPFDPYSHTPSGRGAQQPGMTGQVKEEILTRWGELGLRWKNGELFVHPILLDQNETGEPLSFFYRRVPFVLATGTKNSIEVETLQGVRRDESLKLTSDEAAMLEDGKIKKVQIVWNKG
ncbi:MAG: hypothetical protein HKM06_01670 [Spirochaetales bacterium]|nr:hypothetical protein [Spirochaetales bacterium]